MHQLQPAVEADKIVDNIIPWYKRVWSRITNTQVYKKVRHVASLAWKALVKVSKLVLVAHPVITLIVVGIVAVSAPLYLPVAILAMELVGVFAALIVAVDVDAFTLADLGQLLLKHAPKMIKGEFGPFLDDLGEQAKKSSAQAAERAGTRLLLLLALASAATSAHIVDKLISGTLPVILLVVVVGLLAVAGALWKYPPATLVLLSCINILPPVFWMRSICYNGSTSVYALTLVVLFSMTLSPDVFKIGAKLNNSVQVNATKMTLARRFARAVLTALIALHGAATVFRATGEVLFLLLFWQLSETLEDLTMLDFALFAKQQLEKHGNSPPDLTSILKASVQLLQFLFRHYEKVMDMIRVIEVPLPLLWVVASFRISLAGYAMLVANLSCGGSSVTSIMAAMAFLFTVFEDVKFIKTSIQVRNDGGLSKAEKIAFCLNIFDSEAVKEKRQPIQAQRPKNE